MRVVASTLAPMPTGVPLPAMSFTDRPDERPTHAAEELMRQRRFVDAAARYLELRRGEPTDLWYLLGHVSALECAGDLDRAIQILDEGVVRHRASAPLHRFRQLFYVRREDLRAASQSSRALEQGLFDEGPEDALADLYFNQGRYHEAQAELQRLLAATASEGSFKASLLARLGACLRQLGQHEEAREHLAQALGLDDDQAWTLGELAEVERALGDAAAARRHYRRALDLREGDHWIRGHLAQLEHEQGETDRAIDLYQQIIGADPKAAWARVELAQVLADRDEDDDRARAAALCREALEIDPDYPWAHAHLGTLAKRAEDWAAARAHLLRARQAAPRSNWILHELADASRRAGQAQEAHGFLDEALEQEPHNPSTYGYRADLLRSQERNEEAIANLAKAVELDPDYAWAWRELAELHALAGRHEPAQAACDEAARIDPGAAVVDGLQAFLLRCRDRRQAAVPMLERAVAKDPGYVWAWRELAEDLLILGETARAEEVAAEAAGRHPEVQPLWGLLAEARRRRGDHAGAREALARAEGCAGGRLPPQLWALKTDLALAADDAPGAIHAAGKAVDGSGEYRPLLAQALAAAGRIDDALAALAPALAAGSPPALELACLLHERAGDPAAALAMALSARAKADAPARARLGVRAARLAKSIGQAVAPEWLEPVFAVDPKAIPWREAAAAFIAADLPTDARRAAWRAVEAAAGAAAGEQALAWLCLAEAELCGDHPRLDEADRAVARALAADAELTPARVLAAVLCEQRGDLAAAADHLAILDRRLGDEDGPGREPAVLRQLASIHERGQRVDAAGDAWERLHALRPDDAAIAAERALFLLRRGVGSGDPRIVAAMDGDAGLAEVQRLWREAASDLMRRGRIAEARAVLADRAERLAPMGRLLLAQIHLVAGDPAAAGELAGAVAAATADDPPLARMSLLLQARAALAAGDLAAARDLAERRWQLALDAPGAVDEDCAVALAECLAACGEPDRALGVLDHPRLDAQPGLERGLLAACLAFESAGTAAGLARMGRLPTGKPVPLLRVLASAWPGSLPLPADATREDVAAVPPLPRLIAILADALAGAGRGDLAATLHALALRRWGAAAAPAQVAAAVRALRRGGRRGEALAAAWRHRHVPALLRACLPG